MKNIVDVGREEGLIPYSWVMTCVGNLEWTKLRAGITEGEIVGVVSRVYIKGEPGVNQSDKLMFVGIVEQRGKS